MSLPKSFTTVTRFSKTVALLVFILLPICAFFFGINYQRMLDGKESVIKFPSGAHKEKACTTEAMMCFDGTWVGRSGPNCEFDACPSHTSTTITSMPPQQFHNSDEFICPKEEYVNCMPGFGPADSRCTIEFLQWAQKSCPLFKGGAY